jgi:hypothetical protein
MQTPAAMVAAGTGLVVVGAVLGPTERSVAAAPEPPTLCFDGEPTICFYEQHRRWAHPLAGQISELAGAARQAGYGALVPHRVHQVSHAYLPAGPDIQPLQLDIIALALDHGRMPAEDLVQDLIRPWHCPQLFEESPTIDLDVYFHHQTLLMAAWFSAAQQVLTDDERFLFEGESLPTPDEAATLIAAFQRCDLDVAP